MTHLAPEPAHVRARDEAKMSTRWMSSTVSEDDLPSGALSESVDEGRREWFVSLVEDEMDIGNQASAAIS